MKPVCAFITSTRWSQDCVKFRGRRAQAYCMTEISCKQLCWFPRCAGKKNWDFVPSLVAFGISNICFWGLKRQGNFSYYKKSHYKQLCTKDRKNNSHNSGAGRQRRWAPIGNCLRYLWVNSRPVATTPIQFTHTLTHNIKQQQMTKTPMQDWKKRRRRNTEFLKYICHQEFSDLDYANSQK